ncbi:MAG: hypothetical protein PHT88_01900 [Candidatus Moranbacteria bacterium]|nr:hypothetical protein [Candidatus Moranbacteria bacterium]
MDLPDIDLPVNLPKDYREKHDQLVKQIVTLLQGKDRVVFEIFSINQDAPIGWLRIDIPDEQPDTRENAPSTRFGAITVRSTTIAWQSTGLSWLIPIDNTGEISENDSAHTIVLTHGDVVIKITVPKQG